MQRIFFNNKNTETAWKKAPSVAANKFAINLKELKIYETKIY